MTPGEAKTTIERLREKMDAALAYRHGAGERLEVRDVKAAPCVRQDEPRTVRREG